MPLTFSGNTQSRPGGSTVNTQIAGLGSLDGGLTDNASLLNALRPTGPAAIDPFDPRLRPQIEVTEGVTQQGIPYKVESANKNPYSVYQNPNANLVQYTSSGANQYGNFVAGGRPPGGQG